MDRVNGRIALGLAGVVLSLSACGSQIAALAPVSGDNAYAVRSAAIDVLLEQGVSIQVAPTCTQGETAIVCSGTAVGGDVIEVNAPGKGKASMTITVGGSVVFDGDVQGVLDREAGAE